MDLGIGGPPWCLEVSPPHVKAAGFVPGQVSVGRGRTLAAAQGFPFFLGEETSLPRSDGEPVGFGE